MIHNVHDFGYRKLFSNTTIFKQLLETFVAQDWVKEVDFSSCITLNRTFISNEYKERETDLIKKVKIRDQEAYIYILIEFQSNVQKFMVVRILHYITNLYIYLIENTKKLDKLPAVFPILLYNGDNKWTSPTNITELIENNSFLGEYGINFQYFKIAENEFSEDFLVKANNIVSTLFLTEAHFDIEVIRKVFEDLFDNQEDKQAMSIFFNWFEQFSLNNNLDSKDFNEIAKVYSDKSEVKNMLSTGLARYGESIKEKARLEGLLEGKEKGLLEGKIEGKIEALINKSIRLLTKKIGVMPVHIEENIKNCIDIDKLDKIIDDIFEISSFDEVEQILNQ